MLRDRHRAVAGALDRRRAWQALQGSGRLWAADASGDNVVIDAGLLVATWSEPGPAPLLPEPAGPAESRQVPISVAVAEEAHLLWRWLDREDVTIVDVEHPIDLPVKAVSRLERIAV